MKIIMTGGGTGGHIYPAIAIADKIKRRMPKTEVLFIGGKRGMESRLVPEAGYSLKTIQVSGLNRKNLLKNMKTLTDLAKGVRESLAIIDKEKPDIVIGTGGYVCGPVVLAARLRGVKTAVHEQNAFPGVTNKMLSRFADKVFISFAESEKYFKVKKDKIILSGNPLRKEFAVVDSEEDRKKLGVSEKDFMVLCFAGSMGAARISEAMTEVTKAIGAMPDVKLFFVTGKPYYEKIKKELQDDGMIQKKNVHIMEYINGMAAYISAADVVVSRAGALTISELTACGKPAILIPSPNVTANHQYHNAKVVENGGGAFVIEEKELTGEKLTSAILRLKGNKEMLNKMALGSRRLAASDAAEIIYEQVTSMLS